MANTQFRISTLFTDQVSHHDGTQSFYRSNFSESILNYIKEQLGNSFPAQYLEAGSIAGKIRGRMEKVITDKALILSEERFGKKYNPDKTFLETEQIRLAVITGLNDLEDFMSSEQAVRLLHPDYKGELREPEISKILNFFINIYQEYKKLFETYFEIQIPENTRESGLETQSELNSPKGQRK